jgi:threonine dehydrogenase-like Zn-dependent dehydrogenase
MSAISHGTEMNVYRGFAPQWSQEFDTTLRLFRGGSQGAWSYPLAYGYACVGEVAEIGAGVDIALLGTRAFCYHNHQAVHTMPASDLIPVGDLAAEKAIFFANANTALNGVLGQGVIGQIIGQLCAASGCKVIVVDQLESRLSFARSSGAVTTINAHHVEDVALAVREMTDGRGADTVFDVTGSPRALNDAIRTAAPDCQVVTISWYAVPAKDLLLGGEFHHNRIHIRSSQVGRVNPLLVNWSTERRMHTVLDILRQRPVERMIAARFSPAQAADAYRAVDEEADPPLQAVFEYR